MTTPKKLPIPALAPAEPSVTESPAESSAGIALPEVPANIAAGVATDAELADWLGPDLMNRLATTFRGEEATRRAFGTWYADVAGPLGIDPDPARALFTGELEIDEFAATMPEEQLEDFLERFPDLQAEHRRKQARRQALLVEAKA